MVSRKLACLFVSIVMFCITDSSYLSAQEVCGACDSVNQYLDVLPRQGSLAQMDEEPRTQLCEKGYKLARQIMRRKSLSPDDQRAVIELLAILNEVDNTEFQVDEVTETRPLFKVRFPDKQKNLTILNELAKDGFITLENKRDFAQDFLQ
jgi:hypothetical protein